MFNKHIERGHDLALEAAKPNSAAEGVAFMRPRLDTWLDQADVLVEAVVGDSSPLLALWRSRRKADEASRESEWRHCMEQLAAALGTLTELQIYVAGGEVGGVTLDTHPDLLPDLIRSLLAAGRVLLPRLKDLQTLGIDRIAPRDRLFSKEIHAWFLAADRVATPASLIDPPWGAQWRNTQAELAEALEIALRNGRYNDPHNIRGVTLSVELLERLSLKRTAAAPRAPSHSVYSVQGSMPTLSTSASMAVGPGWGIADADLANALFMDNTTLVTTDKLIFSDQSGLLLTPLTILDLSTFVVGVIAHDHVFHLASTEIDTGLFNKLLGEPVFRTLDAEQHAQSMQGIWTESFQYLNELRQSTHFKLSESSDKIEVESLLHAWSVILGRPMTVDDIVAPDEHVNWESHGLQLVKELVQATDPIAQLFGFFPRETRNVDTHAFVRQVVSECNHRSFFNERVALSLGVPYAANAARMPLQLSRQRASRYAQERISTITFLEDHYRRVSKAYATRAVRLPFFLTALLSKLSRLDDFFAELAELRKQARRFRLARVALDEAVADGDGRTIDDLLRALEAETTTWQSMGTNAVVNATAAIFSACAGGPPNVLIAAAIGLTGAFAGLSQPARGRLVRKLLRPQFSFIADLSEQAKATLDARPLLDRLWGPDPRRDRLLGERLRAMTALSALA